MMRFLWPMALIAAPFVVLAGTLALRAGRIARSDGERLASVHVRPRIRASSRERTVRAAIVTAALLLVVVAIARPEGAPVVETTAIRGADVIVAVDVSLSMLARDVTPSRFERSRIVLRELIDRLEGNRIGLVAFSGSTAILLPLTLDTDAARLFADQLQVQSVDAPGTSIDRAVDRAIEMFDAAGEGDRVLVVISDGEDLASDPLPLAAGAAQRAREAGVSVVTVAVGTQGGAEIPLDVMGSDTLKRGPGGEPIRTRARPDVMAALSADGLAIDASTGDEADRVAMWVADRGHTEHAAAGRTIRRELFQLPLVAALALLCIDAMLGSWRGR